MTTNFAALRERLQSFEDETESWKPNHKRAMECGTLDIYVAIGIALFQLIQKIDAEWGENVRAGTETNDPKSAAQIQDLYIHWRKAFGHLIDDVRAFEAEGYKVAKAEEFRDALGYCLADLDPASVGRRVREMDQGKGISLDEVDKLRYRSAS